MSADSIENNILTYRGCNFLKQRLVLATLSGKSLRINEIRHKDTNPGLREYEISLIRLLDKLCNGGKVDINTTGTSLFYCPGLLNGGRIDHQCNSERGIGYYLDALIALGPFCKIPISATLKGITNSNETPSVDYIKAAAIPNLKKFLIVDDGLELKIVRRGLMPDGDGEILFKCPVRKNMRAIQFMKPGMIKRIRGTAYSVGVPPALGNRLIEAAKGVLLNFIPDIYIYSDQTKGKVSKNCPGYGLTLVAESTEGVCFAAEVVTNKGNVGDGNSSSSSSNVPEDLANETAQKLLEEIYRGGCVDSSFQWHAVLFMALAQKDVSTFLTGPLSTYTIHFLRHLREFFSITFKLDNPRVSEDDDDEDGGSDSDDNNDNEGKNKDESDILPGANKVQLACVGIGYINMNKRTN